jgi:hypothetical protein
MLILKVFFASSQFMLHPSSFNPHCIHELIALKATIHKIETEIKDNIKINLTETGLNYSYMRSANHSIYHTRGSNLQKYSCTII